MYVYIIIHFYLLKCVYPYEEIITIVSFYVYYRYIGINYYYYYCEKKIVCVFEFRQIYV